MTQPVNIVAVIAAETAALRDKVVLIEGERAVTNGALLRIADQCARALARHGVGEAQRVAFVCPDGIDYVALSLAVLSLGAAIVPIAPSLMSDETTALLEKIDVHHVLSLHGLEPLPGAVAVCAGCGLAGSFTLANRGARHVAPPGYGEMRPAFIRFSSGTTGASKGVVLSHRAIVERTAAADAGLCVTSADTIGWVLSMSFHFVVTILLFLRRGATMVICGDPMPSALAAALCRHRITMLYASPIHYRLLAMAGDLDASRLAAVRLAVSTAVKLPAAVATAFFDRFGIRLSEAYGIIEVGLPFIHQPPAGAHDGLLGWPLPAYTVKLGADDEVLISGQGMFDAYFAPWQPRAVCQPDGWFHTGDIGQWCDGQGLRLVGRLKAVINFSGMKIFPHEVEEALNTHEAVAESLVYGEPHAEYGQIPSARVVLRGGMSVTEAELQGFCRARLALHKVPRSFAFVESLDKTASGKLRRT